MSGAAYRVSPSGALYEAQEVYIIVSTQRVDFPTRSCLCAFCDHDPSQDKAVSSLFLIFFHVFFQVLPKFLAVALAFVFISCAKLR